jgi:hypothetical protein
MQPLAVLDDCPSFIIRALVEEHNKLVEVVKELALREKGLPYVESRRFPRQITLKQEEPNSEKVD